MGVRCVFLATFHVLPLLTTLFPVCSTLPPSGAAPMAPVSDRPPRKVPPPSDPERAKVVSALAQRVASNPQFEFVVLAKNINNPLFGPLLYSWCVF